MFKLKKKRRKFTFFFLGPVPTFFSNDPEATLAELKKKPEFGFQCLQALVTKLLARGELTRYTKPKLCFV